jgi:hypothetical protein
LKHFLPLGNVKKRVDYGYSICDQTISTIFGREEGMIIGGVWQNYTTNLKLDSRAIITHCCRVRALSVDDSLPLNGSLTLHTNGHRT